MGDAPTLSSFSSTTPTPSGQVGGAGTTGGAAPTGSVDDLFANLQEFSWGGVSFPAEETDFEIRQRLVPHDFADRHGAYVEGTGRNPVTFTVTIPFLNHIFAKSNETWPTGALYPSQWRLFIAQCLDGTSKTLVHPELGPFNCKLDVSKTKWSGKVRGGVIMQATFVESDDTQAADQTASLSNITPQATLVTTANDLDANIATLQAAVEAYNNILPSFPFSFDELANAIVGVIDIPTVLDKEFQGRLTNVQYQADRILDAVAENPLGPLLWPLFQDCQRQKDAAYNAAIAPTIIGGTQVLTKALAKASTMSQAALFVGSDITSFIALNYPLAALPVIPAGTVVRYYAQTA